MKLNDAQNIVKGNVSAKSVYKGNILIWPTENPSNKQVCLTPKSFTMPTKDQCAGLMVAGDMTIQNYGSGNVDDYYFFRSYKSFIKNQYLKIGPSKYLFKPQDLFQLEADLYFFDNRSGDRWFSLFCIGGDSYDSLGSSTDNCFRFGFRSHWGLSFWGGHNYIQEDEAKYVPLTKNHKYHIGLYRKTMQQIEAIVIDGDTNMQYTRIFDCKQGTTQSSQNYLYIGETIPDIKGQGFEYALKNIKYTKLN